MDNENNNELNKRIAENAKNLSELIKKNKEKMNTRTVVVDPFEEDKKLYGKFKKNYDEIEEKTKDVITKKMELSNKFEKINKVMATKLDELYLNELNKVDRDDFDGMIEKIDGFVNELEESLNNEKLSDEERQKLVDKINVLQDLKGIYLEAKNLNILNDSIYNEREEYISNYTNLENEYKENNKDFSRFEDIRMNDIKDKDILEQAKEYNIEENSNEKGNEVDPVEEELKLYNKLKKSYNDIEGRTKDIITKKMELSNKFDAFNKVMATKLDEHYLNELNNVDRDDFDGMIEKIDELINELEERLNDEKLPDEERQKLVDKIDVLKDLKGLYLEAKNINTLNDSIYKEREEYISNYTNLENEYKENNKDFSRFEDIRMNDIKDKKLLEQANEYSIIVNTKDDAQSNNQNNTNNNQNNNKNSKNTQNKNEKNGNGVIQSNLPSVIGEDVQGVKLIESFLELSPSKKQEFLSNTDNYLRIYNSINSISQSNKRFLFIGINKLLKSEKRNELRYNLNQYTAKTLINGDNKEEIINMFSKLSGSDNGSLEKLYADLYKNYDCNCENPYIMNGKLSKENNQKIEEMISSFNEKMQNGEITEDEKRLFDNYIMKPIIASSINKSLREMGTLSNIKLKMKGWSPKIEKTEKLIPLYVSAVDKNKSSMSNNLKSQVQPDSNIPIPTKVPQQSVPVQDSPSR